MIENFKSASIFKNSFENKCIRLLVEAYEQIIKNKSIKLDFMENDITEIFHININNDTQAIKWKIHAERDPIISDPDMVPERGFANRLKKIDLVMAAYTSPTRCVCFVETKNLKENDSKLKERYISTGIDSFVTEKYPYGFLVGYLLKGAVRPTIDGINELLKKRNREKETLHGKNHEIVQHYYESNHSKMCLKHLILDFTIL